MNKTIKILDLFAGSQSVKKALIKKYKIEYIGLDIYKPNIIFDLTQDNIIARLLEILPLNWKPDFIWASPVCTPFSRAAAVNGGTLCYELTQDKKVILRTDYSKITHKCYLKKKDTWDFQSTYLTKGLNGLKMLNNTIKIINYFNVPFAIENPANALSRYILKDFVRNTTYYCMYGLPYKKYTAIYTNQAITLKQCNHKKHEQVISGWFAKTGIKNGPVSNYERSIVPPALIRSIFKQLLNHNKI